LDSSPEIQRKGTFPEKKNNYSNQKTQKKASNIGHV
jgi:hypothetical protein